ncbi:MAG: hypothetical protein COB67_09735 [SAR324 cluster bacterium]|uniref:Tc1-like transposase DDE domain-containing protein n=1 Tax=SAR324 cluster bacterium TaxID=2024889 RepID=A0A2A4T1B7_9DELT|nr:MAG: hypothetical protein COB67_09735 [SAR324 cluster bacterium]
MHLIHQVHPAFCWGSPKNSPTFPSNSGRKRINILGGYDPQTQGFVHYTNETNCNAESVLKFYNLILQRYPLAQSIILILDNARYFHAKMVRDWLADKKIICCFLPPYALNLNLVERF